MGYWEDSWNALRHAWGWDIEQSRSKGWVIRKLVSKETVNSIGLIEEQWRMVRMHYNRNAYCGIKPFRNAVHN